jgi:hypothetical protein
LLGFVGEPLKRHVVRLIRRLGVRINFVLIDSENVKPEYIEKLKHEWRLGKGQKCGIVTTTYVLFHSWHGMAISDCVTVDYNQN